MTTTRRETVPMPKRIAALKRDARGYPIPYVAQRYASLVIPPPVSRSLGMMAVADRTKAKELRLGIMDEARQRRCVLEGRCSVCGTRIPHSDRYLAGGVSSDPGRPLIGSDFAFREPWVHGECMAYAVQVCPGLVGGHRHESLRIVHPTAVEYVHERLGLTQRLVNEIARSGSLNMADLRTAMFHIPESEVSDTTRRTSVIFHVLLRVLEGTEMTVPEFLASRG